MLFFAFLLHFTRFFACNKTGKSLIFNHLYTQTAPLSIFNVFFCTNFHSRMRASTLSHAHIYSLRTRAYIFKERAHARPTQVAFAHSVFFRMHLVSAVQFP